jgi:hypothetical protein
MLERKPEIQRKAGKDGSLPRSRESSLVGHRSLQSSAGASLALLAWLRCLEARACVLLAIGVLLLGMKV